jgi:hypothetical protein
MRGAVTIASLVATPARQARTESVNQSRQAPLPAASTPRMKQ